MSHLRPTRRIVFHGLGALGVAALLAGCGGGGEAGGATPEPGTVLASASEVPVGGGVIADGVVITQPTEGEFRAFAAVCPHQRSTLDAVGEEGIECPLHGSRFSIDDGSATRGPASSGLTAIDVTLDGDDIKAV